MAQEPQPVTADDLVRWERLCAAASPGPWFVWDGDVCCGTEGDPSDTYSITDRFDMADYQLMAASRTALPACIARVRELEALVASLSERCTKQSDALSRRAEREGQLDV